jgi:hypothetical protein
MLHSYSVSAIELKSFEMLFIIDGLDVLHLMRCPEITLDLLYGFAKQDEKIKALSREGDASHPCCEWHE